MRLPPLALLASVLALAAPAPAAAPAPPGQVTYAGVLPGEAGPVDLTARIFDAPSGGTLLYTQLFPAVALADGHFTLALGPTGAATDAPADPLTTSLRAALVGDLAAGPGRFVEITVGAGARLARVQLVLVPYAMRADHASTSDAAVLALDTQAVAGLDGLALEALFKVYNDDGGPPSDDPREGTADTDGDGLLNFVDPDNDDDGLSDSLEIANGTDINLPTPDVTGVEPSGGPGDQVTLVTVTGTGFRPGLAAVFGAQNAAVSNLTATSFQAGVGPHPGPFPVGVHLTVTNPGGESDVVLGAFVFGPPPAGITVTPLPFFLNPATPIGIVARGNEVLAFGRQANGNNRFVMDTVADGAITFDVDRNFSGRTPTALSWSPARVLHGLRVLPATNAVQLLRDGNADNFLANAEAVSIEPPAAVTYTRAPSLTFDAAGRPGGGYVRDVGGVQTAVAFHDRDGNGSFAGANEVVAIEAVGGAADHLGKARFDPSGRLAYAWYDPGNARVRFAWDRSGDGDFADSPDGVAELGTVATPVVAPACVAASFDGAGRAALLIGGTLLHDRNGDLDFLDAGESQTLPPGAITGCDLDTSQLTSRLVIVANPGDDLRLLTDLNEDGDFADPVEVVSLVGSASGQLAVTTNEAGVVFALGSPGLIVGPVR